MKKYLSLFLIASVFLTATPAQADTAETELRLQLSAIISYIQTLIPQEKLNETQIKQVIEDGVTWTLRAQAEDGSFNYEYLPFADEYVDDNGMVRQAGTLFMLSEVHKKRTEKPAEEAEVIEKAIAYFQSVSAESKEADGEFLCIRNSAKSDRCDLGSTALALIGVLNYVEAYPEKSLDYKSLVDSYSNYLVQAKFTERGFSSRYYVGDGFYKGESAFYNGEAMLALVRFYQYEPTEEVKSILEDVFSYLSQQEYESPLYLWIMAALKDMEKLWPNEAHINYALDFTQERIVSSYHRHGTSHNYCAPFEGLTSAYSVLKGKVSSNVTASLLGEINYWQSYTTSLQLHENNPYRLVFIDGVPQLLKLPNPAQAHGGFLTDKNVHSQRIDFTQHCVSSYLQKLVDIDGKAL